MMKWLQGKYAFYVVVFICSFLQFSNTLQHDYAWDDKIVILDNPDVKAGISGLGEIWHKQHSDYLHDQIGYRPIVLSTFALEQEFFPMQPFVGHLMNVIYFSILCMVILLFVQEVIPFDWRFGALSVTLLFLVHPIHVEVVANIKSRDEIFQLLFSLLSVLLYWKWYHLKKWWMLVVALICFVLAILSRENSIVTVALIPLTILVLGDGTIKQRVKGLWPVLLLMGVGVSIIVLSQIGDAGKAETEGLGIVYEDPALGNGFLYQGVVGADRVLNFNLVMLRYIRNFVWPVDLVYYYGYDYLEVYAADHWISISGAVATFMLMVLALVGLKYFTAFSFGAIFFFIGIFPFLQQFNFMPDAMADRFVFGPSLGLCIASVAGVGWCMQRFGRGNDLLAKAVLSAGIFVLLFYSYHTFQRNKAWKDNYTLFSTDIGKLDDCAKAHEHYADVLLEKYLRTNDASLIPEITYHYQTSIEISDKSYYSFMKLGSNYASFGNPELGIQVLTKAVELFPDRADPNFYLGSALFKQQSFKEALPYLRKGVELSPRISDSHELLIRSYEQVGMLDSAMHSASIAVSLFPGDIRVRDAVCDVHFALRNEEMTRLHLDTLLQLAGTNPLYWKKAIGMHQLMGRNQEADSLYRRSIRLGVKFDQ